MAVSQAALECKMLEQHFLTHFSQLHGLRVTLKHLFSSVTQFPFYAVCWDSMPVLSQAKNVCYLTSVFHPKGPWKSSSFLTLPFFLLQRWYCGYEIDDDFLVHHFCWSGLSYPQQPVSVPDQFLTLHASFQKMETEHSTRMVVSTCKMMCHSSEESWCLKLSPWKFCDLKENHPNVAPRRKSVCRIVCFPPHNVHLTSIICITDSDLLPICLPQTTFFKIT